LIKTQRFSGYLILIPPVILIGGFLVLPLGRLLVHGWTAAITVQEPLPPFVWPHLLMVTRNTFVMGGLTTAVALLIALPLAFLLAKTDMPALRFWPALLTIPMISPPFIMAFSTLLLYGRSGLFSLVSREWFGMNFPHIFGLSGLVLTQLVVSVPYATFILMAGFRGVPRHVEESAAASGAPVVRAFFDVVLPCIYPHVVIAGLMVFLMSIGDVGGPLIIGGGYSVIASEIYNNVLSVLTDDRIAVILGSWIILLSFLMMGVVNLLLRLTVKRYRPGTDPVVYSLGRLRPVAVALVAIVTAWLLLPFIMVIVQSFGTIWTVDPVPRGWTIDHYVRVFRAPRLVLNTLILSAVVTPVIVIISVILGHMLNVRPGRKVMNVLMILPFLLPGVVLALGVIETYAGVFSQSRGIPFYGLLVCTVMVRRLPYTLKTLEAGFLVTDRRREEAATSLGSPPAAAFFRVTLPQMQPFLLAALVIGFIKVATELSASLILAPPNWQSLSMGIVYYIEQGQLGRASAMSVVLVTIIGAGTFTVMYRLHERGSVEGTAPGEKADHRDSDRFRSDDVLEGIVLGRTPVVIPGARKRKGSAVVVRPSWGKWEPRLVVDGRKGIVDANRGFLRLVGADTVEELRREGRFSVLFFGDRTLLEIFSNREAVQERATSIMTLEGVRVPVIVYANVVERDDRSLSGYFYCRRVSGRSRRLREYRRLKDQMAVAEQEILKAQITPHLLFNTLNNISQMIDNEPAEARNVIQSLADLYRYTLSATKKNLVPLAEEVDAIRRYLVIEHARFGDRLTWNIEVHPEISGIWIPPMILQPIVENAVNHGADERGIISVEVGVSRTGDDVIMTVTDHGCAGFDEETIVSGSGTGLRNVEGRIYALYSRHVQFENVAGGGLRVIITIPERRD
jgi:iron(III) transport system permease protein